MRRRLISVRLNGNPQEWDSRKAEHRVESMGWRGSDTTLGRYKVVSFVLVNNLIDDGILMTGMLLIKSVSKTKGKIKLLPNGIVLLTNQEA